MIGTLTRSQNNKYHLQYTSHVFARLWQSRGSSSLFYQNFSRKKMCFILLLLSFTCMVWASYTTHIQSYPSDALYYFKSVSPFYWLGLSLLILILFIRLYTNAIGDLSGKVIDISILFLFTIYYNFVALIYQTIRNVDAVKFYYNFINPTITTYSLDIIHSPMYRDIYTAPTIYFSYFFQLPINSHVLSNLFPILITFFGSIIVYMLATKITKNYAIIGSVFFIYLNFINPHIAPQYFAYILIFLIFLLIVYLLDNRAFSLKFFILLIIPLTALAHTHLLSNIIVIYSMAFIIISLYIINIFLNHFGQNYENNKLVCKTLNYSSLFKSKTLNKSLIYLSVLFIFTLMYQSMYYFRKLIHWTDNIVDSVDDVGDFALEHRTVVGNIPSESYSFMNELRMITLYTYLIISFLVILLTIYIYIKHTQTYNKSNNIYIIKIIFIQLTIFISLLSYGLILIGTGNTTYGYERSYVISLIPLGLLISLVLSNDLLNAKVLATLKIIFVLIIIALVLIHPITTHGSEPYHFFTESEDASIRFGCEHIKGYRAMFHPNTHHYKNNLYNWNELKLQGGQNYIDRYDNIHRYSNKMYDAGIYTKIYVN